MSGTRPMHDNQMYLRGITAGTPHHRVNRQAEEVRLNAYANVYMQETGKKECTRGDAKDFAAPRGEVFSV